MKVGVLSDTHGSISLVDRTLELMGSMDYILHAGDFASDAEYIKSRVRSKVIYVSGNCDYFPLTPSEKVIKLHGHTIFITHGHHYNVKSGYRNLITKAKKLSANIVIYGHTHLPENKIIDNILFFNPGSVSLPKKNNRGTYGILNLTKDNMFGRLYTL